MWKDQKVILIPLYVFDSWGEKSIVRTQELAELPLPPNGQSRCFEGRWKRLWLTTDESFFRKTNDHDGKDPSQPEVVKPSRIEGKLRFLESIQTRRCSPLPQRKTSTSRTKGYSVQKYRLHTIINNHE